MNIGLSTCGKELDEALFRSYRDAGISAMEVSTASGNYQNLRYEEIGALSQKYGITLWSFHLPFGPFEDIDISRTELAEQSIAYFESLIQKAAAIGIHIFVIHPSGEPIAESDRPARMTCAKKSLSKLADLAKKYGAVIAVENLPRTCLGRDSRDMLELISAHPDLKVCFDTNHLLGEDPVEFIRKVGKHFITLHVSDYDFLNERHWLPGEGKMDWIGTLSALESVGYCGPWLYELGFSAPASISRPRDLSCNDFTQNAQALFAGQIPAGIGTPAHGLSGWK